MAEPSVLDERLAEIDRRLRAIQSGLEPASGAPIPLRAAPAAPAPRVEVPSMDAPITAAAPRSALEAPTAADPGSAPEAPTAEMLAGLGEMLEFHQRLLTSTAELLEAYADALVHSSATPQAPPATITASVSAGPLQTTEALRGFQRALEELPQVRDVAVREFVGENRAVVDVHLSPPTS